MSGLHILIIRAILGIAFGIIISRFFYPEASLMFVIILCSILVGLSYVTEYLRRKKKS